MSGIFEASAHYFFNNITPILSQSIIIKLVVSRVARNLLTKLNLNVICCDFVDVSDTSYYCNFEIMAEIEKTNKKNICLCVDPSRSNPNNITNVANQE